MKISDRLSEYGLIGGLFWLIVMLELLMWGWLGSPIVTQRTLELELQYIKSEIAPLTALLVTLGIVTIFVTVTLLVTGILLDLISSAFSIVEAAIFKRHLELNKQWLGRVMDQNRDYIQKDWPLVLNVEWIKLD